MSSRTLLQCLATTFAMGVVFLARTTAHAADDAPRSAVAAAAVPAASGRLGAAPGAPPSGGHIEGGQTNGRWREGSRMVDQTGSFRRTGDRVTFLSADGKLKFDCLENLCVERIARTITDSPDSLQWSASGMITECAGTNYLLVTQAVLKNTALRQPRSPN